ncbi:MAG: virulence protein RhuM/Fic/DOC family protein [Victivallales bacterium]|nr:virulence protein RhuM/Fic/DOC family protein [Victivallales bacterium]
MKNEIVLFESSDHAVKLEVTLNQETVWLTQAQMAELFDTARSSIAYHIGNIFKENEVPQDTSVEIFDKSANVASRPAQYYNLDVIISVGYRVKSQRGVEFRRWANSVLKEYLLRGVVVNRRRLGQLGMMLKLMRRAETELDAHQVLSVVQRYHQALDLLDDYDHQVLRHPQGHPAIYRLTYEECRRLIDSMRFGKDSELFGNEKDESFRGSIGNIYQSFGGQDVYPTLEEKAAHLLYFVVKNHSFSDGNKRIAAAVFLHFLDRNRALYTDEGEKRLDDRTLVALIIMVAESRPEEKELMISVILNCLSNDFDA